MIIIELFRKSYTLVKYNLVLIQPLLLFFLLVGLILGPVSGLTALNAAGLFLLFAIMGLFSAFLAGWYNMFHKTVQLSDKGKNMTKEERAIASLNLFKEFFPGVGKFFPRIISGLLLYVLLFVIIISLTEIIGVKIIGALPEFTQNELNAAFKTESSLIAFINTISPEEKVRIVKWTLLKLAVIGFYSYLTMFWTQAVIAGKKTGLAAYWESLKAVVQKPLVTSGIFASNFLSLLAVYFISTLSITLLGASSFLGFIAQFIGLILIILLVVYFTMMSFLYFEKYRKNNSVSWTDSFR